MFVATLGGAAVKSGTGTQTQSTITYTPGAADATQSTLTPASASITANGTSTQVLTVQARDANGNNLTSGGSTVTITKSSGTGTIGSVTDNSNGTYTATVTAPTATGSGVFVATLGGAAVKSGAGSQTQATVTYSAGTATKLQVLMPGETAAPGTGSGKTGTPTAQTAGTATTVTVNAVDANWNVVSSATPTVAITSSDGNATLPANAALVSGTKTFSVTFKTVGSQTVTATDVAAALTANTGTATTVNAGTATKLQVLMPGETAAPGTGSGKTGTPTAQTAGTATTVTVNAVDANWNVVSSATPTVAITSSDGNATLPANAALVSGTKTFSVTLKTVGSQTVTATDQDASPLTANTGTATIVNAAVASKLVITGTSTQTAGATQNLTITAYDAYANVATGYTGDKSLTFSGANSSFSPVTAPTVKNKSGTAVAFGATTTITFASGVASVSGGSNGVLTLYKVETATVSATDGTISSTGSDRLSVTVSFGSTTQLVVTTQPPIYAAPNAVLSPSPTAAIADAYGNVVTTDSTHVVTVTLSAGTGTLSGTKTVTASAGLATFATLSVDLEGAHKRLTFSTTDGIASATSDVFLIGHPMFAILNNGNWCSAGTWSNTSGGASNGDFPSAQDLVVIGEAGSITVNIGSGCSAVAGFVTLGGPTVSAAVALNFTDATSTLTVEEDVVLYRPVATNTVQIGVGTGTLTSNGHIHVGYHESSSTDATRVAKITVSTGTLSVTDFENLTLDAEDSGGLQAQVVFSGAGTLNIAGGLELPQSLGTLTPPTGAGVVNFNGIVAQAIPIGVSAVTYGNLTINNTHASGATLSAAITGTNVTGNLTIGNVASGSLLNNGGYAITLASGKSFTVANGSTFKLGGSSAMPTVSGGGTRTFGATSTVNYAGSGQTVSADTFGNLTLSASGAVALTTGTTINGNLALTGTATAASTSGTVTFSGTGTQTISCAADGQLTIGSLAINATVTNACVGALTVSTALSGTGTLTQATNAVLNIAGTTSGPTVNAATNTPNQVNYTGSTQTLSTGTYDNLAVTGGGTATLGGNVTVNGDLLVSNGTLDLGAYTANRGSAGGTLQVNTGSTLKIGGTGTLPSNYTTVALQAGSTVEYAGSSQTVASRTYENLSITGSGTKTLGGAMVANGNVAIGTGATLATSGNDLTFKGNFTNGGTFTAGSSAIIVAGTGAQSIAGFTTTGTLTMSKTAGTATLGGNVAAGALTINGSGGALNLGSGTHTISGAWTMTAGTVNAGTSTLQVAGDAAGGGGVFNAGTGTVVWNKSGSQTIAGLTYYNVALSGGGTKTVLVTGAGPASATRLTAASAKLAPKSGTTVSASGMVKPAADPPGSPGNITVNVGGTLDQGCTTSLVVSTFTINGSYLNCNSSTDGGTGNLTTGDIVVGGGAVFDFIGSTSSAPTITLWGDVSNSGLVRIWGGGRSGGAPVCSGATVPVAIASGTGSTRSWAGAGEWHISTVTVNYQSSTGGLTIMAWNSTAITNSNWTAAGTGVCEYGEPTAIKLISFTATPSPDGMVLKLRTGRDVANLGFNLYREVGGKKVKLNATLLAGTALMGGIRTTFTAGQVRRWVDNAPVAGGRYWLEEVDARGPRTWYGPATDQPAPAVADPADATARIVATINAQGKNTLPEEAVVPAIELWQVGSVAGKLGPSAKSAPLSATAAVVTSATAAALSTQYTVAATAGVRLDVKAEGWYRVPQPQLVAAGIPATVDPRKLQLYLNGVQQDIVVDGESDGKFGSADSVRFYAMGTDTLWSDTQAYFLIVGSTKGTRAATINSARAAAGGTSFATTVQWKPRVNYMSMIRNGDASNFFGPIVSADGPMEQAIATPNYATGAVAATLRVKLQGITSVPHAVRVELNGQLLGTMHYNAQVVGDSTFTIPTPLQATNSLVLNGLNEEDYSMVDTVQLTYQHLYAADGNYLRFTAATGKQVAVSGFTSSAITAIDVTDPANVSIVKGTISGSGSNYTLAIVPSGSTTPRTLIALAGDRVGVPGIATNKPSSLHAAQAGYDLVIIGPDDLLPSAAPLAARRQARGRKVAMVSLQNIYDEFSFGVKNAQAIKTFLATAKANWTTRPTHVLLLGNGTSDPRNFLATGVPDKTPAKLVDTAYGETASDDWYVDFNDDGLPDMAIGRLPAEFLPDAELMVDKVLAYDDAGAAAWKQNALLLTGAASPGDNFSGYTASVRRLLPAGMTVTSLTEGVNGNSASVSAAINSGQGLVNYAGHGSVEIWSDLFSSSDAYALTNQTKLPVVLSMTCLAGYIQDPTMETLAKALMNAANGGAVAVWASSSLTEPPSQAQINQAFLRGVYGTPRKTIGEAAAAAKAATIDPDVRRTWNLLGDPSMYLQ